MDCLAWPFSPEFRKQRTEDELAANEEELAMRAKSLFSPDDIETVRAIVARAYALSAEPVPARWRILRDALSICLKIWGDRLRNASSPRWNPIQLAARDETRILLATAPNTRLSRDDIQIILAVLDRALLNQATTRSAFAAVRGLLDEFIAFNERAARSEAHKNA